MSSLYITRQPCDLAPDDYDDRWLFCTFATDSRGEVQFLTGGIVHNSHSGTDMV